MSGPWRGHTRLSTAVRRYAALSPLSGTPNHALSMVNRLDVDVTPAASTLRRVVPGRARDATRLLVAVSFLAALACFAPNSAAAHHIVTQYGIAPAEPVTRASLELEVRQFDFDAGPSGTAEIVTPRVEYAPWAWLSGIIRLPIAGIQYDAKNDQYGIGDLALGLQGRIYATEHGGFTLSAGVGAEFPTGDPDTGLGSGHFELSPFVVVSAAPTDDLVLFGSITEQISLGGAHGHDAHEHDHDAYEHEHEHDHGDGHAHHGEHRPSEDDGSVHGAVIAPHEDHELRTRIGAAYVLDPFYFAASSSLVVAWRRADRVGPLELTGELGWRPRDELLVSIAADVPAAGPKRFLWAARFSAVWTF